MYCRPPEPMPFISPKVEPFLVTHSLPRGPSVTYGMRSLYAALALAVKRSGGSQIRSRWESAEMTSYFIFRSSVRACDQHDSPEAQVRLKFPGNRNAGRADGATRSQDATGQHAVVGCDRARFRPDLSGALCELSAGEGRRLCHQDRAAARRAGMPPRRAGQERNLAVRDAEPEQARDHLEPQARARPGVARRDGQACRCFARKLLARDDGRSRCRL